MDQQSMSHIREIQETRKQLAAAEEKRSGGNFGNKKRLLASSLFYLDGLFLITS